MAARENVKLEGVKRLLKRPQSNLIKAHKAIRECTCVRGKEAPWSTESVFKWYNSTCTWYMKWFPCDLCPKWPSLNLTQLTQTVRYAFKWTACVVRLLVSPICAAVCVKTTKLILLKWFNIKLCYIYIYKILREKKILLCSWNLGIVFWARHYLPLLCYALITDLILLQLLHFLSPSLPSCLPLVKRTVWSLRLPPFCSRLGSSLKWQLSRYRVTLRACRLPSTW